MRKILGLLVLLLSMQVYAGTTENQVQDEAPESVELKKGNSDKEDRYNCFCKTNWFSPNVCTANASGIYCGESPCAEHDAECR